MSAGVWQELPCNALDIGVGPAGGAWICGASYEVFQWTGAGWSRVAGEARRVAVGPGDEPWIVGTDDRVRRREGGRWVEVSAPVRAVDVGVEPSGRAWMTGQDGELYRLVDGAFVSAGGAGLRVGVSPGRVCVVGADGLLRLGGAGTELPRLPGDVRASEVDVAADGTVWCVGRDLEVYRLGKDATTWTRGEVLAAGLAVGPDGALWVIRRGGGVARQIVVPEVYTGRDLVGEAYMQTLQCTAVDVAVGPTDDAWIVATDRRIHRFTGSGWSMLDGLGLRIAVGPDSTAWVIGIDRAVFRREGANWVRVTEVPGGAEDLAVGPSGVVWIVGCDKKIYCGPGVAQPVAFAGDALRIAVDREDRAWVVTVDGSLFRRVGEAWESVLAPLGGAADVGAGADGSVWVTGSDRRLYRRRDDGGWSACQVQATSVAVAPHGGAWAVQQDTQILRHTVGRIAGPAHDHVKGLFWRYLGRSPSALELELHLARLLYGVVDRDAQDREFSACPESVGHLWAPRSDLLRGLFWMYLGRAASAADIEAHIGLLAAKTYTEATLEEYFRTCPEATARGSSSAAELVRGLWWRYLGVEPTAQQLSEEVALALTREERVARVRDRADAQARRRPYAREYLTSLFWEHLGRAPGESELAWHAERLVCGTSDRDALAAEFAGCEEATRYRCRHAPLTILGAAYIGAPAGQEDVTATVRGWVHEHQILRGWSPADFGAAGEGSDQALVIVYQHGKGPARTKIVPLGWTIELWPRVDDRTRSSESCGVPGPEQLTILGAVYGRRDVTTAARSLAHGDRLYADVNDATWGHGWMAPGAAKSLVVVFRVGAGAPVVQVGAPGKRVFINAPPLKILGATFGGVDVTGVLAAQVRNGTLEIPADGQLTRPFSSVFDSVADAFADGIQGVVRTLAVVYRHGDETERAKVLAVPRGQMLVITPETAALASAVEFIDAPEAKSGPQVPRGLRILGAVYGLTNVTGEAIERVRSDLLEVCADDATWGSGGMSAQKTLTIVYQIDGGRPMVRFATQGVQFWIGAPQILGATWGPLDVTDRVAALVRGGVPGVVANNQTFCDSHPGKDKFFTVCYRYGEGSPQVRTFREGEAFSLPSSPARRTFPPSGGLQILGASWGPRDITVAARFCDRDLVRGLFARYIGRDPLPAELDGHVQRLVGDQVSEAELEGEFAACGEGLRRASYAERDFVQSLFARYIKRAPSAGELDGHADQLFRGLVDRVALEQVFRTCPEAQLAGPPNDTNFVNSLSWRYHGRAPDAGTLSAALGSGKTRDQLEAEFRDSPAARDRARLRDRDFLASLYWRYLGKGSDANFEYHLSRLVDGVRTREALAEEFRTCPEACAYAGSRTLQADSARWGDSLPGKPKLLTVVYRVGDGEPRVAVAQEGESLTLPEAPRDSAAHLLARVRTMRDYQAGDAAGKPTPRAVHQLVLVPRRRDGAAIAADSKVKIVCSEPLELFTDNSGADTVPLAANEPLELAVPAGGQCRLAIAVKDGEVTAPLVRARWNEMAPDVWAVIAMDQHLHATLAELRPEDLLDPPDGATSPVAAGELGRSHALRAGLAPALRTSRQTALRVRLPDGRVCLARAAELGEVTLQPNSSYVVPPHVVAPTEAALSRALVTGATRHYRLRGSLCQRLKGSVQPAGLLDFIDDIADAVGDAFKEGFDAVSSALTTAFRATVGAFESAFRWTVEGLQSLVSVAEHYATTAFSVTKDALGAAQCVLLDATNGLVAFVVTVRDGVMSVARTVIDTIEDVALLVADQVARVAMKIKEVIEFIIMMWLWNWTDILETQRYLADVVKAELDAFPQFAARATDVTDDLCDSMLALIGSTRRAPDVRREAIPGLDLGPLGDAFEFIYDRLLSGISALIPDASGDAQLASKVDAMVQSLRGVQPPAFATSLVGETDPNELLDTLRAHAGQVIEALRGGFRFALEAEARAAGLVKDALDERISIPVLTDLIELIIFRGGSKLTPLTLVTLLAGAGYNNMYKLLTGSKRGPFRGRPAYRSLLAGPAADALVDAGQVSFDGSEEPDPLLTGAMAVLGAVCSTIAFLSEQGWKVDGAYAKPMSFLATVAGLIGTTAEHRKFGRWVAPQLIVSIAHCAASLASSKPEGLQVQKGLGAVQVAAAAAAGIGMLVDEFPHTELITLRMSSEVLDGFADVFADNKEVAVACTVGSAALSVSEAITSLIET